MGSPNCPTCERQLFTPPHSRRRYWIISVAAHTLICVLTVTTLYSLNLEFSTKTAQRTSNAPVDHDVHLVGNPKAPLNHHETHKTEYLASDGWSPQLYFGEPNYDSDNAWNDLIEPRGFRVHRHEAERLNLTDSVNLTSGEDFGTMLGVMHNLHCLRRIRQMLYPEYYHPDADQDELHYNRMHSLHCLESIRSSVTCYPDLNPHPYFWSGNRYHDITVSAQVTRQCVDWKALQKRLKPRDFEASELMKGTGPSS